MNIWGIGPILVLSAAVGLGLGRVMESYLDVHLGFSGPLLALSTMTALALFLAGVYLWLSAAMRIRSGVKSGKLLTDGVYARTRNPLYAAFVFFLLPALALLLNNLAYLLSSVLMYAAFDQYIEREENALLETFGDEYRAYCARTPRLFPRLRAAKAPVTPAPAAPVSNPGAN
ncbi:MAG: isoprenylcysteine carboxylmethyltransferase family protein [Elusimicrobia bacterium]|nr:isoprenylcysteine carboxylmethyltransferase family protein [Elusimicrobiota bacterium]